MFITATTVTMSRAWIPKPGCIWPKRYTIYCYTHDSFYRLGNRTFSGLHRDANIDILCPDNIWISTIGKLPCWVIRNSISRKTSLSIFVDILTLLLLAPQACSINANDIVAKTTNLSGLFISYDLAEFQSPIAIALKSMSIHLSLPVPLSFNRK